MTETLHKQAHEFVPLHCKENISIVNPFGFIGVVTLWSRKEYVTARLSEMNIDLDPLSSPIAAVGNLYGNGLKFLIANLLYNPGIRFLLICGRDRSGSLDELTNFFYKGVEEYESLGKRRNRIINTKRTLDNCLTPSLFDNPPEIVCIGDINDIDVASKAGEFFNRPDLESFRGTSSSFKRLEIELQEADISFFPSHPGNHDIVKKTPLDAWKELIFRLYRFGCLVDLGPVKGKRQELQNVRVIVKEPAEEKSDMLDKYGFSTELFRRYGESIVSGEIRDDEDYNYGNRIGTYFGVNGIEECIRELKQKRLSRRAFISMWDPASDLTARRSAPCLVSLFFRVFDGRLTLTAVFRVHNAVDAWLQNFYGLMKLLDVVSNEVGIKSGSITVISHSISINSLDYEKVLHVVREKERNLEFEADPNGQFRVSIEEDSIVVRHIYDGENIGEYSSKKAERIQYELKRDHAISDIAHAIYIGRQLEKAERCLVAGEEFIEDQ